MTVKSLQIRGWQDRRNEKLVKVIENYMRGNCAKAAGIVRKLTETLAFGNWSCDGTRISA